MQTKKAYYIMKAIQCGCTTVTDIVEFIKDSDFIGLLYDYHVRNISHELRKYGYISKKKVGQSLVFGLVKRVNAQSEIKLNNL